MRKRILTIVATLVLSAAAVVAVPASAQAFPAASSVRSVTCPSGSGTCTEYGYQCSIPDSGGTLGIYYTGQWSSTGGSYKIVRVRWVNNSVARIYWNSYGVYSGGAYNVLGVGSQTWYVSAGASWTFNESSFNGAGKGKYFAKGQGASAISAPGAPWNQYQTATGNSTGCQFGLS